MLSTVVRFSRKPFDNTKGFNQQGQLLAKFFADDYEEYDKTIEKIRENNFQEFNFPYIWAIAITV